MIEPIDKASFFKASVFGIECLTATFARHRFAAHAHETYVIGAMLSGRGGLTVRGTRYYAEAGDLTFLNPQDVHDGVPLDDGYSYRVSYPPADVVAQIARDLAGEGIVGLPCFADPVVHDPRGADLFVRAHRAWECGDSPLRAEEMFFEAHGYCLSRYAHVQPRDCGRESGPVARVAELLADRFDEKLTLSDLAEAARISSQRLIRAFRLELGLTPHAYLVNRRVDVARGMLREGERPADVAAASGFSDQAHFIRSFKARTGVTPGSYQAAVTS